MFLVQVNDNEGVLNELVHVGLDQAEADSRFLSVCAERLSNWSEYTAVDVQAVLENGYEKFGGGVVMLIDTSNCVTDDELREALNGQPAADMKVEQVIHEGEVALKEGMTVDEIVELCANNLDSACSWDIQGQVVFKGSNGKYYTITTESSIGECSNEFITDVLSELENE